MEAVVVLLWPKLLRTTLLSLLCLSLATKFQEIPLSLSVSQASTMSILNILPIILCFFTDVNIEEALQRNKRGLVLASVPRPPTSVDSVAVARSPSEIDAMMLKQQQVSV